MCYYQQLVYGCFDRGRSQISVHVLEEVDDLHKPLNRTRQFAFHLLRLHAIRALLGSPSLACTREIVIVFVTAIFIAELQKIVLSRTCNVVSVFPEASILV